MLASMSDMKVKQFSDYRAPTRRPWLYALLIIALVGFAGSRVQCSCRARRERREEPEPAPAVAEIESPARPGRAMPPSDPVDEAAARERLEGIDALIAADDLLAARERLFVLRDQAGGDDALRRAVERRLGTIHIKLIMSPRMMPEKEEYLIRSGDSLARIAHRFGTTPELLQISNNVRNPNLIRVGDRLRVLNAKFELTASTTRHDLVVTLDGRFFKRYRTGTGTFGRTPTGTFRIRDRIEDPTWWRPDGREIPFGHAENILGTRWMGIIATGDTEPVRGYGIHGTWEPESIGSASSAGCLRMLNSDVEELFLYIPLGTAVTITE